MKKRVLALALISAVSSVTAQEIQNPLIEKLYEKGVLTKEEAINLDKKVKKEGVVSTKDKKLKFEGLAYIGYTYKDVKGGKDEGYFEIRRGYYITKFYFNKKDYVRFTLDVTAHNHKDNPNEGKELNVKLKHLYLYKDISSFVPYTGFEIGLVHTPWLDYEEHSGWWQRSISKTFFESSDGAHLLPSADTGIDFKTKTEYVSAEYGVFDGEGYDHYKRKDKGNAPNQPMIDGRLTWHVLGGGTKKPKPLSQTYANVSIHALDNYNYRGSHDDLTVVQLHAVYNQPLFLIAGQYIHSDWYSKAEQTGNGFSVNFEIRPLLEHKLSLFGRYDFWNSDNNNYDRKQYIYGVAWHMNKHVTWLVNGIKVDYKNNDSKDYNKYMVTAEVHF